MRLQVLQLRAEIILTRETDTVDGAAAVLTEINLVAIGLEDFVFLVMRLEQQRHRRLIEFTGEHALVAQEKVFHELLCERAAALHHTTNTQKDPQHTNECTRIDTPMGVE